uniref:DegT/DnrJ/EryC1/StrS family aminotransferase n=1 Tax=Roseihalotalea indica TaxID=2867963 RepID=A0AA49JGE0_9BACT|nr:DegT/DnrJ/EryC1/StrS family aminotransferase [Tunicatimonas sp. TK19036]
MKIPFVDLARQHAPLINELQEVFTELLMGGVVMGGEAIVNFEQSFASWVGTDFAVSCANATDALEIVLRAWNIGTGDEVIVPANGWMSAAETVCLVGATPVFVDNQADSYSIDEKGIEEKITEHTKAIIPIHLYGDPANLPALMAIAEQYGLKVLEDCAQAHGASVEGKKVGSWGHAGIFSFYPTKNLGALGDGGMIVTQNEALAQNCRAIAQHGQYQRHTHQLLGRNSRMDAIQAKILSLKLPYLDQWNSRRKQIADYYCAVWKDMPMIVPVKNEGSVRHLFVVQMEERDEVRAKLSEKGITTEIHYPIPVCQQPVFQQFRSSDGYPLAETQASRLLSIPVYPELTDVEVENIGTQVKKVIAGV